MSEIPLHTFGRSRKSRAGYTPLHNGEPGEEDQGTSNRGNNSDGSSKSNLRTMHAAVRAAVTSSTSLRKGKQRERYADDPGEEETLLGSAALSDSGFRDDGPEEERRESSQVRRNNPRALCSACAGRTGRLTDDGHLRPAQFQLTSRIPSSPPRGRADPTTSQERSLSDLQRSWLANIRQM